MKILRGMKDPPPLYWDAADAEADWQAERLLRECEATVRERKKKKKQPR